MHGSLPRPPALVATVAVSIALCALALCALVDTAGAAVGTAAGAASSGVLADPPANTPAPALLDSTGTCTRDASTWNCQSPCAPHLRFGYNDSAGCLALALSGLDRARASEALPPARLPADYGRLDVAEQLFVVVNLERIARKVPPLVGLAPALDDAAELAARDGADVTPAGTYGPVAVRAVGATWAGGAPNAVAAVFGWMYQDGWGGPKQTTNGDCTSPTAQGCWGHRHVLLGEGTGTDCQDCVAGSADATIGSGAVPSYAFVVVAPRRARVALSFTWNQDVLPYLPPSERVRAG